MSQENVKAFFEKVETDEDLSDRYKSLLKGMARDVDEEVAIAKVVQFASERGYEFASEDLRLLTENTEGEELSDEELDAVAGGGVGWGLVAGWKDDGSQYGPCVLVGWG